MRKELPRASMEQIQNNRRPRDPIEALMEAPPNAYPEESQEELEERMQLWAMPLADAMAGLDERERFIVEQVVLLNRSYRSVARELGLTISTVHKILNGREDGLFPEEGALSKLRKYIEEATELEL